MRGRTNLRTLVAALCLVLAGPGGPARADNTVDVAADQTATVIGQFDSLKTLLADLCQRGQCELRAYDADDRAVHADYEALPLTSVVRALLSNENYLLGQGPVDADGKSRVAWVHVSGNQSGAITKSAARNIGKAMGFDPPPATAPKPAADAAADAAMQSIAAKLLDGDDKRAQFLASDTDTLAESLHRYPDAPQLVRRLIGQQNDPQVIQKLTEVLAAMD